MTITRRRFLSFLGAGIATAATPAIVEPVRKLFFVPSNAPVGSRVERFEGVDPTPANFARWVNEQIRREHDDRLYMFREQRTREELAAMYPEPTFRAIAANPAEQHIADLATHILNHDPAIRAAMAEARKRHRRDVEEALLYGRGPYAQELAPRVYSTGLSFESWDPLRTNPEQAHEVATRS